MPSATPNRTILFDDTPAQNGRIEIDVSDDDFTVYPSVGAAQAFIGDAADEFKTGLQAIVDAQAAGSSDPDGDGVVLVENKSFTLQGALPGGGDIVVTHNPSTGNVAIGAIPGQDVAQFGGAVIAGMVSLGIG